MKTDEIYRKTNLGKSLNSAIKEVYGETREFMDIRDTIMCQFDKSISDALSKTNNKLFTITVYIYIYFCFLSILGLLF